MENSIEPVRPSGMPLGADNNTGKHVTNIVCQTCKQNLVIITKHQIIKYM